MSQDYGKILRSQFGARYVNQHSISPNFFFHAPGRGGKTRKVGNYAKIRYGREKDIQTKSEKNYEFRKQYSNNFQL